MFALQLFQNPELVARLEKIKAHLAHQEYNKMVQNLPPSSQVWRIANYCNHYITGIHQTDESEK